MSLVLDAGSLRKIKISLDDYGYTQDISHRIVLHQATQIDIKVLEEILFSSIKTSKSNLLESLEISQGDLDTSLEKFKATSLIKEDGEILIIDKELRKYFESEIQRFEEDFEPGIDFLAQILKKVPIHILPAWYSLPRTSTNIFESIIEKYLLTPQVYQRLLSETQTHEPSLKAIIDMLFTSDSLELDLDTISHRLNLNFESLFEIVALLEFNLIACLSYRTSNDGYKAILTPYQEFKNYLIHIKQTEAQTLNEDEVNKITLAPFAFIEGLFTLLKCFKSKSYTYPLERSAEAELKEALAEDNLAYLDFEELFQKLLQVQLIDGKNHIVNLNETSFSFMSMKPESAALVLYRHPSNRPRFDLAIPVDKAIRECEKASCRLIGKGWVLFEDFLKGMLTPFNEDQQVILKKTGRKWQYHLPIYSLSDKEFIKHMFIDWFEKVGVIETGFYSNKHCIRLSSLGTEIFS
jgi:hypothetical protein